MTNYPFTSLDEFNDVSVKNEIKLRTENGEDTSQLLETFSKVNRDNARTMMQWNSSKHAGFSNHEPWFHVNPNYVDINVEQQLEDEESLLNFYKKMIKLKKENDVFNYGVYELIDHNHEQIYTYKRKLNNDQVIVMSNLTNEEAEITYDIDFENQELLLHNYKSIQDNKIMAPFETRVYRVVN